MAQNIRPFNQSSVQEAVFRWLDGVVSAAPLFHRKSLWSVSKRIAGEI